MYEAFRDGRNHAAAGLPLRFRRATERHDETRAASFDHLVGAGKTNTQIGFFGCIGNIMFFEQF